LPRAGQAAVVVDEDLGDVGQEALADGEELLVDPAADVFKRRARRQRPEP
jgi:hypothetical protein